MHTFAEHVQNTILQVGAFQFNQSAGGQQLQNPVVLKHGISLFQRSMI